MPYSVGDIEDPFVASGVVVTKHLELSDLLDEPLLQWVGEDAATSTPKGSRSVALWQPGDQ